MSQRFEELDWLLGETQLVPAGQVLTDGTSTSFVYDRSYLALVATPPLGRPVE